MNKDLKCEKDGLSLEILDKVTGGAPRVCDTFEPECNKGYWNEKENDNDITNILDPYNPHS